MAVVKSTFIEDGNYFELTDDNGDKELRVDYVPVLDADYDESDYEIYIFENKYLNAENDVFQIYEKKKDTRIGWIFPIAILESNENDFSENKHLNKYKFVAFKKLLKFKNTDFKIINVETNKIQISEVYGNNSIILILSKKQLRLIEKFSLVNYYPSFASFGYFIKNEHKLTASFEVHKKFALKLRSKTRSRINVNSSGRDLNEFSFFEHLYTKYLKTLDHHLIRFHLLYQVIEHFIDETFDSDFNELIEKQKNYPLRRNDFFEKISSLKSERGNIKKVFSHLNETNLTEIQNSLKSNCKMLLKDTPNDIGDLVYDVRNLVVHDYRKLTANEVDILEDITSELELIINQLI